MKTTTTISNIAEALLEASNIAILTHIQPDGDALGSSLALMLMLRRMGKNARVFCKIKCRLRLISPLGRSKYTR